MSDFPNLFDEPQIANPEVLAKIHEEYIRPVVDFLYGEDFSGSEPGRGVSIKIGKGALKLYIATMCFEDVDTDDEGTPVDKLAWFRQTDVFIGFLADETTRDQMRREFVAREEADEDNTELDKIEAAEVAERAQAWEYFKITFDYETGAVGDCIRYVALDNDEDDELLRITSEKSDRDSDVVMTDELALLEGCTEMHLGRLIGKAV